MSRSERYIAPSDEELRRLQESIEAAKQFDNQREQLLKAALNRCKKADLVRYALRIAQQDKGAEWILEQEIGLDKPIALLAHDIQIAVDLATKVDKRRPNCNFHYDWRAYEAIHHGLSQLVQKRAVEEAKLLALTLMEKGSYQIECSDEGLMHGEIEHCLRVVISAVAGSPSGREWALKMRQRDRTGFLCEQELIALTERMYDDA